MISYKEFEGLCNRKNKEIDHQQRVIDRLTQKIETLKKENKELQDKINKAIEYVNHHNLFEEEYDYNYDDELELSETTDEYAKEELLEILKGESND